MYNHDHNNTNGNSTCNDHDGHRNIQDHDNIENRTNANNNDNNYMTNKYMYCCRYISLYILYIYYHSING